MRAHFDRPLEGSIHTTRQGCQLICAGDNYQSALTGTSGLARLEQAIREHPHEDATIIRFPPKDNCRSGIAGHLAGIFEKEGGW